MARWLVFIQETVEEIGLKRRNVNSGDHPGLSAPSWGAVPGEHSVQAETVSVSVA